MLSPRLIIRFAFAVHWYGARTSGRVRVGLFSRSLTFALPGVKSLESVRWTINRNFWTSWLVCASPCTARTAKLASASAQKRFCQSSREPTAEDPPEAVNFRELTLSLTQNTGPLENTRWRAARKLARARGDGDAYRPSGTRVRGRSATARSLQRSLRRCN